jgi:NADPH:quinone reductase-like Zn-dependent oxidoreductase
VQVEAAHRPVLQLAEAGKAHMLLEGRQSTGKIVLKVAE